MQEKVYDVGFILCRYMYESSDIKEYLGDFIKYLRKILGLPVIMIVGKEEKSGRNCKIIQYNEDGKILSGIQGKKEIYYEEEMQIHTKGLCFVRKVLIFS